MEKIQPTGVADRAARRGPFCRATREPAARAAARQTEDIHISLLQLELRHPRRLGSLDRAARSFTCAVRNASGPVAAPTARTIIDRYDQTLDSGTEAILQDLTSLSRANMQEHVEAFAAALWSDRILPEDF